MLEGFACAGRLRRGGSVVAALAVAVVAACGGSSGDPTGPSDSPGSILVTIETSGFLKGESYELLVDGVSEGTVDASGEVTVSDLEPASYDVGLGDVPDNCVAEGVTVSVAPEETVNASLTVECAYSDPEPYTIQFNRERPDLDTGEIMVCPFGFCDTNEEWDLYVHRNTQTDPSSVIRQNQTTEVEIAHLEGTTLEELTEADFEAAEFTTEFVADPFDAARVILIRTDVGNVFALGNPVEDSETSTLTFDAALIAVP